MFLGHYLTSLQLKLFPHSLKYLYPHQYKHKFTQNSQFGITSLSCAIYTEYDIEDKRRSKEKMINLS